MIGDNKIVKAINGTTAAVLSLRGNGLGLGSNAKSDVNNPDGKSGSGGGGFGFGGFIQGLFGLGDSNAIPVRIVQSWGDILHQGLFGALGGIFGFADGGDPPLGRPSWVGERGPELFIPKTAGTIIPNHALRAFAATGNLSLNGGNRQTFGDIHVHGVQNARDMMRQIASIAKTASPQFSPAASR
jgi:hypothetical protein